MKLMYILAIAITVGNSSFAQTDTSANAAPAEAVANSTLTLGVSLSNNVNYYGQSAAEKMPYVLALASWQHHSGFYLMGAGYKLLQESGGAVSASSAAAGFGFRLSSSLSADVNYSHTFYPTASPFIQAANANSVSASVSLHKWLTTTANVDYAFGKTNDVFTSLTISKPIQTGTLFSDNDGVSITPAFELIGGTRHFYETYVTEKRLRDSIAGIPLPPLSGGGTETESTTKSSTAFDFVSYNFKLPVSYSRARYEFEVAWQLAAVSKKVTGSAETNSFFIASFYYQF